MTEFYSLTWPGIGKKDILTSQGITTLVDLPGVGENLREWHISKI